MSNYVYVIVNKINLKLYFGSHSWDGEGLDPNYYGSGTAIKRAVRKYGKENFIIQPIKFYNSVEECRKAEEELLTRYDIANNPYCYNLKNGAVGWTSEDMIGENNPNYGKPLSEEHRRKIAQSQNRKKVPVVSIDKNGKVKIFKSQAECSRVLGIDYRNVNDCLKGKLKTCKGYVIKHLKRCGMNYKITKRKAKETEKIKLTEKIKGTTKRKGKTPIVAIQKDTGKIKIFESIKECARQLNLHPGSISNCLKGSLKSTGGYTFKYIEQLESGIYEGITEGIAE